MLETIGRYRLAHKIGEGGMGVVFAARDESLDRPVAIKMIRGASDERAQERFWREARAAASINHPNVCQLYEVGEEGGYLFLAMELLEGESLAARLARSPLAVPDATPIAISILTALEALHRRGLIHRDLKPSNVFLTTLGVKLLDFGLARPIHSDLAETASDITQAGTLVGTPQYVAPEQVLGQPVDHRADLFAAGALLFEMLTGKTPFGGRTIVQVLHAVTCEQPPVLGGSPAVAAIDRVIQRALAKAPEHRYQTADAMADELRAAMLLSDSGDVIRARPMTRLIVLPLRILRADPETDFLAFSLSDAITSSLAEVSSLVVRSSATASRFASEAPDMAAIASQAEVDIVLTGTLLRAADQVRVTTQLVEAVGGAILWSQTSQAPLGDVFSLQDELARRIVDSLSLPLTARDHRILKRDVPANAKAFEFYLRANELSDQPKHRHVARDLYLQCLDEDPRYAPAWAKLGRLYRVIAIYSAEGAEENYARAEEAFKRSLELNSDLSLAHNLATYTEVEAGRAKESMLRLLARARRNEADPELYAGLVQACRYCGLLEAAVAAYEHARRLDPAIRTSVNHAYLMLGEYERAIATSLEDPPLIHALVLALMGRTSDAIALFNSLETERFAGTMRHLIVASRASLEGKRDEARRETERLLKFWHWRDPCSRFYLARHLAYLGDTERALQHLRQAIEGGFYCFSFLTRDAWLDSLRTSSEFRAILRVAEVRQREALSAFLDAEGQRILGLRATAGLAG